MSEARSAILDAIKKHKTHAGTAADVPVQQWLGKRAPGPQPQWQQDRVERFAAKLEQASATLSRVESEQELSEEVATYLERNGLGNQLVCGSTALVKAISWPSALAVEHRAAQAADGVVMTEAYCGIAETGSLVLLASPDTPTSLNFLTDHFLCILQFDRIVDTIEDVWQRMRDENKKMARAVNFITGPSRTADVELTIQLGVHGPRFVHVLLVR